MKTWVRRSLNAGVLTAGALLVSGAAAQANPVLTTTDNVGLLNGTQALIPVQVPVNVCGNAVNVLGVTGGATASCTGGAVAGPEVPEPVDPGYEYGSVQADAEAAYLTSYDNWGLLNGTQVLAPVQVPIDICGNAVGVLGSAGAYCTGGAVAR